jgi:hypothetical protein
MEESAEVYRNYRIQGTGRDTSKSLRLIWELAGQDFPVLAHDGGMEAFQPVRVWMAKLYQMFFYKYVFRCIFLSLLRPEFVGKAVSGDDKYRQCDWFEHCQWETARIYLSRGTKIRTPIATLAGTVITFTVVASIDDAQPFESLS